VVDGDTLWMKIYLRPRLWLKEKLRLRGLDCPELDTAQGQAAKRDVEALVNQAVGVTITTTKPDKWDRYLSDVFLEMSSAKELYLNNRLLENGLAVRRDSFALSDWENWG
jgi:endonuclease YncB( thermonuclease family)